MLRPDKQTSSPAIALDPIEDLRHRGLALRAQGMHEEAEATFAELLARQPRDARSHVDRAISLRALGRFTDAIAVLTAALDDVCSVAFRRQCILHLARSHQATGKLKAARLFFEEAARHGPEDVPVLLELASLYTRSHDIEAAKACLTQIAGLLVSSTNAAQVRSYVLQQAEFEWLYGDPDTAIDVLRTHSKAQPTFPIMRRLLAYLARRGRTREAMEGLQRCYARGIFSTKDETCFVPHIETLRLCGDFATAHALGELGLSVYPNNQAIRLLLSDMYMSMLDVQSAHDVLPPEEPVDMMLLAKAKLFKIQGETKKARALLEDFANLGNLGVFRKNAACNSLFHLELFSLNFNAAQAALCSLVENSFEQHLTLLLADQHKIFHEHTKELQVYLESSDPAELCILHLRNMGAEFKARACCLAWMFINRIGKLRRWWSVSQDAILAKTVEKPRIPARIMQYWDQSDIPGDVRCAMESWRIWYPDFEHSVFNRVAAQAFLSKHFSMDLLARFNAASHPAMRSDIFRMAWLAIKGGFYIDADEICLGRSPAFFLNTDFVSPIVFSQEYETQNGFIGSVAGHAILSDYIANLLSAPEEEFRTDLVWWLTGPGHMSRVISIHLAKRLLKVLLLDGVPGEMLSSDAILVPKSLLEMTMMTPRLEYKQSTLSWQRARSRSPD